MARLRRLYGKSQKAVSRSDPLQGSDKNRAGRQATIFLLFRQCEEVEEYAQSVMGNTEAWKQLN